MKVSKMFSSAKARVRETRAYGAVKQYQYDPPALGIGSLFKCAVALVLWTVAVHYQAVIRTNWGQEEAFRQKKAAVVAKAKEEAKKEFANDYAHQEKDRAESAAELAKGAAADARAAASLARKVAAMKTVCRLDKDAQTGVAAIYEEANQ